MTRKEYAESVHHRERAVVKDPYGRLQKVVRQWRYATVATL